MTVVDVIGYIGSVVIAASLMMPNIKRLRWINLAGASIFCGYGALIGAVPVMFLNGWIVVVDIYYLIRLYRFSDQFDLVRLSSVHTSIFKLLLREYGDDIRTFFPTVTLDSLDNAVALLIFRNMKPVGIFAYQLLDEPGEAEVLIDYVIPEARDFKTARFLFTQHAKQLTSEHISTLISRTKKPGHIQYLLKMGFVQQGDEYRWTT